MQQCTIVQKQASANATLKQNNDSAKFYMLDSTGSLDVLGIIL